MTDDDDDDLGLVLPDLIKAMYWKGFIAGVGMGLLASMWTVSLVAFVWWLVGSG